MTTARRPFHGFRFPADLPGSGGAEAAPERDDRCGWTTPAGVTTAAGHPGGRGSRRSSPRRQPVDDAQQAVRCLARGPDLEARLRERRR
jgi:hypothetical protein